MLSRSNAELFLSAWGYNSEYKIFKYVRYLVPTEYVVFRKTKSIDGVTDLFHFSAEKSSYICLKSMYTEGFIDALTSGQLIFHRDFHWGMSTREMKTGGCVCGAWILRESERIHDFICPLNKDMFKR